MKGAAEGWPAASVKDEPASSINQTFVTGGSGVVFLALPVLVGVVEAGGVVCVSVSGEEVGDVEPFDVFLLAAVEAPDRLARASVG